MNVDPVITNYPLKNVDPVISNCQPKLLGDPVSMNLPNTLSVYLSLFSKI